MTEDQDETKLPTDFLNISDRRPLAHNAIYSSTISSESDSEYLGPTLPELTQKGKVTLRGFYDGSYSILQSQYAARNGQLLSRDPSQSGHKHRHHHHSRSNGEDSLRSSKRHR